MTHLPPVGRDHIGCSTQPRGTSELGHDFPTGVPVFSTAWVFCVGQNIMLVAAQRYGFLQ
ncbi:hypothetical protein D3C80_1920520 [compost metagenome]